MSSITPNAQPPGLDFSNLDPGNDVGDFCSSIERGAGLDQTSSISQHRDAFPRENLNPQPKKDSLSKNCFCRVIGNAFKFFVLICSFGLLNLFSKSPDNPGSGLGSVGGDASESSSESGESLSESGENSSSEGIQSSSVSLKSPDNSGSGGGDPSESSSESGESLGKSDQSSVVFVSGSEENQSSSTDSEPIVQPPRGISKDTTSGQDPGYSQTSLDDTEFLGSFLDEGSLDEGSLDEGSSVPSVPTPDSSINGTLQSQRNGQESSSSDKDQLSSSDDSEKVLTPQAQSLNGNNATDSSTETEDVPQIESLDGLLPSSSNPSSEKLSEVDLPKPNLDFLGKPQDDSLLTESDSPNIFENIGGSPASRIITKTPGRIITKTPGRNDSVKSSSTAKEVFNMGRTVLGRFATLHAPKLLSNTALKSALGFNLGLTINPESPSKLVPGSPSANLEPVD